MDLPIRSAKKTIMTQEAMTYEGRIRAAVRANGTGKIKVTFTAGDKNCSVTIPAE